MAEPTLRPRIAPPSPGMEEAAGSLPREGRVAGPLVGFLQRIRPGVEEMLARYQIPAAEAEEILRTTLQVLAWKWESVRDREAWLMAVMERKCRLAAVDRSKRAVGASTPGSGR